MSQSRLFDSAFLIHIKDNDGQLVFHSEGDGGFIHDLEALRDDFKIAQFIVAHSIRMKLGITIIDTVNLGRFQENIGAYLVGSQSSAGVGCKKGIAGAAGENHNSTFFEMPNGSSADEIFGALVN